MTDSQCDQPVVIPEENCVSKFLRSDSPDFIRHIKPLINRISYFAARAQNIISFST
jgi:hypothetical protein